MLSNNGPEMAPPWNSRVHQRCLPLSLFSHSINEQPPGVCALAASQLRELNAGAAASEPLTERVQRRVSPVAPGVEMKLLLAASPYCAGQPSAGTVSTQVSVLPQPAMVAAKTTADSVDAARRLCRI